jgi:hypothetical protein
MEEPILYHEEVILPLFNIKYNVIVSKSMDVMAAHVEDMYDGIPLNINPETMAYTCVVRHSIHGTGYFVLINSEKLKDNRNSLVHEAVSLSWVLLENIGVELSKDTKVIQGYMCETIYKQLLKVMDEADETNIDSL